MDGIGRRKGEEKSFGVFECAQVAEHPLTQGLSKLFRVPRSRWNGMAQEDLIDSGYSVLSRIAGNGVDAFVKQDKSLFVFSRAIWNTSPTRSCASIAGTLEGMFAARPTTTRCCRSATSIAASGAH